MIKRECIELSEFIFTLKDRLTDGQFKYLLDKSKRIFDISQEFEEESFSEQEDNDVCNCNISELSTYKCIRNLNNCIVTQFYMDEIQLLDQLIELMYNNIPVVPLTFTLKTKPVILPEYEITLETLRMCTNGYKFLLRIHTELCTRYTTSSIGFTYRAFSVLILFDYLFRHFNCIQLGRDKGVLISIINTFLTLSDCTYNVQTIIPHINIIDVLNKWKSALIDH